MDINFSKETFLSNLSGADMVVHEKMGFSRSAMVLLDAKDGKIIIYADNGEAAYKAECEAEVIKDGRVTFPYFRLQNLIRQISSDEISLKLKEDSVGIIEPKGSKRKIKITIRGMAPDEIEENKPPEGGEEVVIDQSTLKTMINSVAFAAANEATRYALNGVLVEIEGKRVSFVASDGRRLAVFNTLLAEKTKKNYKAILPANILIALQKQLGNEGPVRIFFCWRKEGLF